MKTSYDILNLYFIYSNVKQAINHVKDNLR